MTATRSNYLLIKGEGEGLCIIGVEVHGAFKKGQHRENGSVIDYDPCIK